jgi:hypothetical protein
VSKLLAALVVGVVEDCAQPGFASIRPIPTAATRIRIVMAFFLCDTRPGANGRTTIGYNARCADMIPPAIRPQGVDGR